MITLENSSFRYCDADEMLRNQLVAKLNVPGRHCLSERIIHLDDGFTIVAMSGHEPVGVISICWKRLPAPLSETTEAFIDLIDVDPSFRRQGLARKLVELATSRAIDAGAYQMRAWTSESEERTAAIAMWRALGFALCPTEILAGPQAIRVRGWFAVRRLAS